VRVVASAITKGTFTNLASVFASNVFPDFGKDFRIISKAFIRTTKLRLHKINNIKDKDELYRDTTAYIVSANQNIPIVREKIKKMRTQFQIQINDS
jgi:hypothetical protein